MMIREKTIYFDIDGTIANFYGVEGWLDDLEHENVRPYIMAKPLVNMSVLARRLNQLQREGWHIGIVSWLSKNGSDAFKADITIAKKRWLDKHLASVHFDEYNFLNYGTPKQERVMFNGGILFDDEKPNRENWIGTAYDVDDILGVLKSLI